jgi:hypothetical protein
MALGIVVSAAVAISATIIRRHFTLLLYWNMPEQRFGQRRVSTVR